MATCPVCRGQELDHARVMVKVQTDHEAWGAGDEREVSGWRCRACGHRFPAGLPSWVKALITLLAMCAFIAFAALSNP